MRGWGSTPGCDPFLFSFVSLFLTSFSICRYICMSGVVAECGGWGSTPRCDLFFFCRSIFDVLFYLYMSGVGCGCGWVGGGGGKFKVAILFPLD